MLTIMDEPLFPAHRLVGPLDPGSPASPGVSNPSYADDAPRFPLPQRHRRYLACAAVAASIALGCLGVGATVETVQHQTVAAASDSH
jgi:hypothetical protein